MKNVIKSTTLATALICGSVETATASGDQPEGVLPQFDSVEEQLEAGMRAFHGMTKKDAKELLEPIAAAGCGQAQFMLSRMHQGSNDAEAIKWAERAAEQGHTVGLWQRGHIEESSMPPETGYGSMDRREAAKWYKRSAEKGYFGAMIDLWRLYDSGVGVGGVDIVEAYKWRALVIPRVPDDHDVSPRLIQGRRAYKKDLKELEAEMSESQVERAKRLVHEWEEEYDEIRHVPAHVGEDFRYWFNEVEGGCHR